LNKIFPVEHVVTINAQVWQLVGHSGPVLLFFGYLLLWRKNTIPSSFRCILSIKRSVKQSSFYTRTTCACQGTGKTAGFQLKYALLDTTDQISDRAYAVHEIKRPTPAINRIKRL
jgi:hypothetical protein